jgi:hypothetical protein
LLHITNGDCAVAVLSQAVSGSFLPWRDVLHEGPVRAGLTLEQLSAERARFIADAGWASREEAREGFRERDAAFLDAGRHDEIVLWFEHDLYDQLQLIQVLDGLADLRGPPISLVCEAEYLGTMTPERAAELFSLRTPLTRRHFQEAQAAWRAFRSPDPRVIAPDKPRALHFLGAALRRHLEEFPWTTDGVSRLERSIVEALKDGPLPFDELFRRVKEEPQFLGHTVLAWHLERLQRNAHRPRWLGGYEVRDERLRWDPASGRLTG